MELLCLEIGYYHPICGIFRENMIEHDDTPPDLGVFLDKPIMMIWLLVMLFFSNAPAHMYIPLCKWENSWKSAKWFVCVTGLCTTLIIYIYIHILGSISVAYKLANVLKCSTTRGKNNDNCNMCQRDHIFAIGDPVLGHTIITSKP